MSVWRRAAALAPAVDDTDVELLRLIAAGDQTAIARLVDAKLPRLLALAERMLGDRGEAEDVTQDAFTRVWRNAGSWKPGAARFDTWLHRVTLNLCYDRLRRRRDVPMATLPDRVDPGPQPGTALDDADEQAQLAAALASLPVRQREAVVLTYYQSLTNIQSAAAMGVSVEAVESLLGRARRTLRRLLTEEADD